MPFSTTGNVVVSGAFTISFTVPNANAQQAYYLAFFDGTAWQYDVSGPVVPASGGTLAFSLQTTGTLSFTAGANYGFALTTDIATTPTPTPTPTAVPTPGSSFAATRQSVYIGVFMAGINTARVLVFAPGTLQGPAPTPTRTLMPAGNTSSIYGLGLSPSATLFTATSSFSAGSSTPTGPGAGTDRFAIRGNLIYTISGGNTITVSNLGGFVVKTISGSNTTMVDIHSIYVDAGGNIYAGDWTTHNDDVFGPNATGNVAPDRIITGPTTHVVHPIAFAVDRRGDLYASDGGSVYEYAVGANGDTPPIATYLGYAYATGVALDENDSLYIVDEGTTARPGQFLIYPFGSTSPALAFQITSSWTDYAEGILIGP